MYFFFHLFLFFFYRSFNGDSWKTCTFATGSSPLKFTTLDGKFSGFFSSSSRLHSTRVLLRFLFFPGRHFLRVDFTFHSYVSTHRATFRGSVAPSVSALLLAPNLLFSVLSLFLSVVVVCLLSSFGKPRPFAVSF